MDITVCTFNIRYDTIRDGTNRWSRRREQVYRLVVHHDWDIVGMQEALHSQVEDLRDALPHYGILGVGRDDGATRGEHCPILYRRDRFEVGESGTFWLAEDPDTAGQISWNASHPRICTWARLHPRTGAGDPSRFTVYNTHTDNASALARERGIAVVLRRIADAGNTPAVLMGDFNATEHDPAMTAIHTAAMINTHPPNSGKGTYHGFTGRNLDDPIDHIFVSPDWRIDGHSIVTDHRRGRYPSDHFPVTATLHLPD